CSREYLFAANPALFTRVEPDGERLGIPAQQQALRVDLEQLRRDRQCVQGSLVLLDQRSKTHSTASGRVSIYRRIGIRMPNSALRHPEAPAPRSSGRPSPSRGPGDFSVVAIGASAGGLEALRKLMA